MRVRYNLLTEEGQRIAKRGGKGTFSLLIGTILSLVALLVYTKCAPQPKLPVIEIWLELTLATMAFGVTAIEGYLYRTLPRHHVSKRVGEQTASSHSRENLERALRAPE